MLKASKKLENANMILEEHCWSCFIFRNVAGWHGPWLIPSIPEHKERVNVNQLLTGLHIKAQSELW
jgi:hypothetical protein